MVDGSILNKVLGSIKEIMGTKKFDDTKMFIEMMINCRTLLLLKNVVILITCVIKGITNFIHGYF